MTLTRTQIVHFKTKYAKNLITYLDVEHLDEISRQDAYNELKRIDQIFKENGLRTTITVSTEEISE